MIEVPFDLVIDTVEIDWSDSSTAASEPAPRPAPRIGAHRAAKTRV